MEFLKEKEKEEQELAAKIESLRKDCEQFELPVPNIAIKTIDWEIWQVLKAYHDELKPFESQPFVKIKTEKLYEFQDFCTSWNEKIKTMEKTKQTMYILK